MSEVTEGELVMWSVDPGPMAGVLERKLWRMATAARSYLNRMRAAELAHGVVAGERDAVIVENDRTAKAIGLALTVLSGVVTLDADDDTIVDAANKAAAEHRQMRTDHFDAVKRVKAAEEARDLAIVERDEAYKQRDSAQAKVTALEAERAGVAYFACWPDGMLEALGATDVSGVADVMGRVRALVGAERERDEARAVLHAFTAETLPDAARRTIRRLRDLDPVLEALGYTETGSIAEVIGRVKVLVSAERELGEARYRLGEVLEQRDESRKDLRGILRARDGESLEAAACRLAASRDEMMEEASRARTELGARADESAEDAALRVMRNLLKAQSALGEVFEIQHEITIAGDLVTIRVAPLRDPAIRALPLGVRLGLVVCDE